MIVAEVEDDEQIQQGDVVEGPVLGASLTSSGIGSKELVLGGLIVTQSCDLQREGCQYVHVAEIVELDRSTAHNSLTGSSSRYAELPELGPSIFADLGALFAIDRGAVQDLSVATGLLSDARRRRLATQLSRRFTRYAFADGLQPLFGPLRDLLIRHFRHSSTDLRRVLDRIETVRIEFLSDPDRRPWSLRMVVVLKAGELAMTDVSSWDSRSARRPLLGVAMALLAEAETHGPAVRAGWEELVVTLSEEMMTKSKLSSSDVSLEAEVVDVEDFTYRRYLESVDLDLDALSDPPKAAVGERAS